MRRSALRLLESAPQPIVERPPHIAQANIARRYRIVRSKFFRWDGIAARFLGALITMPYDPTIYRGSAAYYARGRPPYSRALVPTLAAEVGLNGSGRLLDVGCGPGVLAILLADCFAEAIALDPDPEMLAEGARRAA